MNIVPKFCEFEAEIRQLPGYDTEQVWSKLSHFIENSILPEMQAVDANARIEWQELSVIPDLSTSDDALIQLTQELSGTDGTHCVSFGTEGGLFEQIGVPSVVCGPGHISQAHKPNEFIEIEQIQKCEKFLDNLIDRLE